MRRGRVVDRAWRAARRRAARPRSRGPRTVRPAGVLVAARRDGGARRWGSRSAGSSGWSPARSPLLLLVMCVPFLFGARSYDVDLALAHERVVAGDDGRPARSWCATTGARTALPGRIDIPVGAGLVEFGVPLLRPGHTVAQPLDDPRAAPRHRHGRPRHDGPQRPGRPAAPRARVRRRPRAVRAPAHHRAPVDERRAHPRPRGQPDPAARRRRHVVPRDPRVRARGLAAADPLEVHRQDRAAHGAPVRGVPAIAHGGRARRRRGASTRTPTSSSSPWRCAASLGLRAVHDAPRRRHRHRHRRSRGSCAGGCARSGKSGGLAARDARRLQRRRTAREHACPSRRSAGSPPRRASGSRSRSSSSARACALSPAAAGRARVPGRHRGRRRDLRRARPPAACRRCRGSRCSRSARSKTCRACCCGGRRHEREWPCRQLGGAVPGRAAGAARRSRARLHHRRGRRDRGASRRGRSTGRGASSLLVGVAAVVAAASPRSPRRRALERRARRRRRSAVAFLVLGVPLAVPSRLGGPLELAARPRRAGERRGVAWKDLVTVDLPVGVVPQPAGPRAGGLPRRHVRWCCCCPGAKTAPRTRPCRSRSAWCLRPVLRPHDCQRAAAARAGHASTRRVETALGIAGAARAPAVARVAHSRRARHAPASAPRHPAACASRAGRRPPTGAARRSARRHGRGRGRRRRRRRARSRRAARARRAALGVGPDVDLVRRSQPARAVPRRCSPTTRADDVLFTRRRRRGCAARARPPRDPRQRTTARSTAAAAPARVDAARFVRVPVASLDAGRGRRRCDVRSRSRLDGIWMPTAGRLASVDFDGDRRRALADGFYYSASAAAGVRRPAAASRRATRTSCTAVEPAQADSRRSRHPAASSDGGRARRASRTWVQQHVSGSGGAALAGLVDLLRERGYLSHALDDRATAPPCGRSRCPATASSPAPPGTPSHASTRCSRACWSARPIRGPTASGQLRRGGRRRRAVRRRGGAHRPRARLPGARRAGRRGSARRTPGCRRARAARAVRRTSRPGPRCSPPTGEWVPIDVDAAVRAVAEPRGDRAARPRERHRGASRRRRGGRAARPCAGGLRPATTARRCAAGCDLAWLWPVAADRRHRAARAALLLGPFLVVDRRRRPRVAARAGRRRARRRGSRAAGTSTWMPRWTRGRARPVALTRSELAAGATRPAGRADLAAVADRAVFSDATAAAERTPTAFWQHRRRGAASALAERGVWRGIVRDRIVEIVHPTPGTRSGAPRRASPRGGSAGLASPCASSP